MIQFIVGITIGLIIGGIIGAFLISAIVLSRSEDDD